MENLFESVRDSLVFNKFRLNDLVCVEYTCPVEGQQVGVFTQSDYIVHVLSGKKTWKTIEGEWDMEAGQTIFVKKGAALLTQYFEDDFCMLGFFLPDDVIRESLTECIHEVSIDSFDFHQFTATKLLPKDYLKSFIQSMFPYFKEKREPPRAILKLKIKELLINLYYHSENELLVSYFKSVVLNSQPSLSHIMETNFTFNLRLEEFAKMCHRSLSKFKRDFFDHYNSTPGKWLLNKRLDYAAGLLLNKELNITQIAFDSGFEDISHFSRVFKNRFGVNPSSFSSQHFKSN